MEKHIGVRQARKEFSKIIQDVYINGHVYVITHRHNKVAVLRRPDIWRQISINKTEKQIEKLATQISDLLKEFY